MDLGLSGRACVITGGSQGVGRELARRLVAEGGCVLLVGRREAPLREAVAELGEHSAASLAVDITDRNAGERVAAACIERYDRLDVLVNSAGAMDLVPIEDLTDEMWEANFALHVMAPLRLMRAAIPRMLERGWGRVVNVGSSAGRRPGRSNLAYGASKSAELSLSRGYAEHYASRGVLVNAVNPGPLAGEMWLDPGGLLDQSAAVAGVTREEALARLSAGLPLGRMGTTREVADVIAFLCSELAGNVVGAAWSIDGGAVPSIF
ncbi:MAG TPA: SDR family oxidoreductase [Solirubrobacteraceae bacterium]|jgi:NAD(P)-dependent dehydrogenase (short-subunit alcohol dehydrogenase family)